MKLRALPVLTTVLGLLTACGGQVVLPEANPWTTSDAALGALDSPSTALASDNDYVYICSRALVRRARAFPHRVEHLFAQTDPVLECGRGVVANNGALTWICGTHSETGGTAICRWAPGWPSAKQVIPARSGVRAIAQYQDHIYWLEGTTRNTVVRARVDGTDASVIVPEGNFELDPSSGRIAVDESGVYWVGRGLGALNGGALFRVSHSGGAVELLDRAAGGERGISLSETEVVYVADSALRIVSKSGRSSRTLGRVSTLAGAFSARGISADASNVWIAVNAATGNQLLRVARADGATTVDFEFAAEDVILDVVADGRSMFFLRRPGALIGWTR